jgi:signal transduction histidine kinase
VALARDISEQELAQSTLAASEERLREGEALAHVGSWSLDVATGAMQWSAEHHQIYGIDPLEFGGTLDDHVAAIHVADRDLVAAAFARATDDGEPFETEHRVASPGREGRHVYTRGAPVLDAAGRVVGIRGISQDVTEHHLASDAMRAAYERERSAAEELRVAAAMKDDFLSIVSHELRTPLTSIIGFTALLDGVAEGDRAEVHQRISRNATEMQRMVERLLDFSRLQSGAVYLQPKSVGLRAEIERGLAQLDGVLDAHDVVLDVPPSLAVLADRDALSHVLTNLLSNAAKFSPAGTTIEVRGRETGVDVRVAIADQGPGIEADLHEKVFERFFQAVPSPTGSRGAGVGLAIVREYVQRQGGRVWCESTLGNGSTFVFTLPAGSPAA